MNKFSEESPFDSGISRDRFRHEVAARAGDAFFEALVEVRQASVIEAHEVWNVAIIAPRDEPPGRTCERFLTIR